MSPKSRFERQVLPHLDAAFNLARWLARSPQDAEDVVQDACVRALRYIESLRDGDAKSWFLTIVRNAFYDWVARNRPVEIVHDANGAIDAAVDEMALDPLLVSIRESDSRALTEALAALPLQFREVIVLRELEDLSYRQIAAVVGIPIGTVMSRLARARTLLRRVPALQPMPAVAMERKRS